MAKVLRQLKFDAWVMHTQTSSFVTVGSFDSRDDPEMQRTAHVLATMKLGPIELMQPLPAEVPETVTRLQV